MSKFDSAATRMVRYGIRSDKGAGCICITYAHDIRPQDHYGQILTFGSLLIAHDVDEAHESRVGGVVSIIRQEGDGQQGGLSVHVAQHMRSNRSGRGSEQEYDGSLYKRAAECRTAGPCRHICNVEHKGAGNGKGMV